MADNDLPRIISHYRLDRLLGRGAMGAVYEATDRRDDTRVAVKLLHTHLLDDDTFRQRFEREAHVGALLRSPYTVHLLDYGAIEFTFHDLSSGDRISGPMCSHCNRENRAEDADCWYCGTSLVNAPTTQIRAQRVVFRLVDASGERFDVHEREAFVINGETASVVEADAAPQSPDLLVRADGGEVTAAGPAAGEARALSTGDSIEAAGRNLFVVVR